MCHTKQEAMLHVRSKFCVKCLRQYVIHQGAVLYVIRHLPLTIPKYTKRDHRHPLSIQYVSRKNAGCGLKP